ncbi:hypothetical protein [Gordonia sp. (in: high G+C Gram-positive bacteria)]|uniref:hypothetical protein n=1 Tax=Gordonia sp. (in: high G+C Gram-positive bacteria) TaxID=84139 RepID=UPI0025795FE4|nr:hypothetical protein [Gordonia sp. (in: high G+C Gram-positive bacteria)]
MTSTERVRDAGEAEIPPGGRAAAEDGIVVIGGNERSELSDNYPAGVRNVRRRGPVTGARRDVSLDVRLTRGEKDAVAARARALGVRASRWARAVILDALDVGSAEVAALAAAPPAPDPQIGEAVDQLRRVGVLLNQERRQRAAEGGEPIGDDLLADVLVAVDDLRVALGDRTRL